jgi:hypothetical protein
LNLVNGVVLLVTLKEMLELKLEYLFFIFITAQLVLNVGRSNDWSEHAVDGFFYFSFGHVYAYRK